MDIKIKKRRAQEILSAAEKLYNEKNYKDITLKDISALTSLGRSSIYNYYSTKEEIFMSLLGREYEIWQKDLDSMKPQASIDEYSKNFAEILGKRKLLFRILSTNFFEIEQNVSLEALVKFKKTYLKTFESLKSNLNKSFPNFIGDKFDSFIHSFLPFMFGIHPYTSITEKQKKAMESAGISFVYLTAEYYIENQVRLALTTLLN